MYINDLPENFLLPNISEPLVAWYRKHARPLPWRKGCNAYHTWVSEIMLQQTRVEAVIPYYNRFLQHLPTIEALANADLEQLNKLWQGLGYYSRVRNMQKAAQQVVTLYNGVLPADYNLLLTLPGIGPYTAGAIASIAYGQKAPAVDGNVMRVLSRLFCLEDDIALPATKKGFTKLTWALQSETAPGDFTQGIMELGACICIPNGAPKCAQCPLQSFCTAFAQDCALTLPVKSAAQKKRQEHKTLLFCIAQGKLCLQKRPDKGLLAGLWQPVLLDGNFSKEDVLGYVTKLGGTPKTIAALKPTKHIFTHIVWDMEAYAVTLPSPLSIENACWITPRQIADSYPVPSAFKAALTQALPFWQTDV
ncbi:MAG: A/G-specific adenine glycosylase [Oscillospiraceae bacterium]|nr:A/G-specific adenine glycosylase [Oscillospiraceae bacterium]